MGKIEKLLDKTKRNGEIKKWKMYVFVVIGILIIVGGCFGLYYLFLEPVVKTYISDKPISHLYDFYDLKVGENQTAVYFLGNSQIGADVYIPLIQKELDNRGYSDIRVYNIYRDSDNPLRRVSQIENIIDSQPSRIIYGISPWTFTGDGDGWVDEDVLLVKDRLNLNPKADSLYSEDELADLYGSNSADMFYMKRFFKSAVTTELPLLLKGSLTITNPITYTTNTTWEPWTSDEKRERYSNTFGNNGCNLRDYVTFENNRLNTERNKISVLSFTGEKNKKVQAFEYILNRFTEEQIPVTLVIMPDHSMLNEYTPAESELNFRNYIKETGYNWYDLDSLYGDEIMADLTHVHWDGAVELAPVWADIVIKEMT